MAKLPLAGVDFRVRSAEFGLTSRLEGRLRRLADGFGRRRRHFPSKCDCPGPDANEDGSWLLESTPRLPLRVLLHGIETDTHAGENGFSQGAGLSRTNEPVAFSTARPRRTITTSHGTASDHDLSGETNPAEKQGDASLQTRI